MMSGNTDAESNYSKISLHESSKLSTEIDIECREIVCHAG